MERRDFLINAVIAGFGLSLGPKFVKAASKPDISIVKGNDPYKITKKAIELIGGLNNLISKGDVVVVKPNIGWDRVVELAGNTNPEVVRAVVEMTFDAGAKEVRVMDNPCNDARRTYIRSGIKEAAEKAGADVKYLDERRLKKINMGGGVLKNWPVYSEFLEVDKIINVPIAKHHGLCKVTLGMKNWLGAVGGRRRLLHQNIHQVIVDMSEYFKPALTVLDAYRVRFRNGPQGTNPADVRLEKTIIAGVNPTYVDAYGTTLLGHKPEELSFLRIASKNSKATLDLSKYKIARASF